jgi:1-acyl-sn-glycerol-3-phosphate acyltransferase
MARADDGPLEVRMDKTPIYYLCRTLSDISYRTVFPHKLRGTEHLPATGGVLIASNHQSVLDIPLLSISTRRHVSFVARQSLAKHKWLAYVMSECRAILIRRGVQDRQALRQMVAHLEQGDCVSIFPEGTRTSDGRVQALRRGALLPAKMAGVPVVPAAIRGTFTAWSKNAKFPRPARVSLQFGPPVDPSDRDAAQQVQATLERLVQDGFYSADAPST